MEMHYPPYVPESHRFAVGHEAFGLVPGLMMYATVWLREHNRVCDVLRQEHPDWDDERLFQTTRLILIGEGTSIRRDRNVLPVSLMEKHNLIKSTDMCGTEIHKLILTFQRFSEC